MRKNITKYNKKSDKSIRLYRIKGGNDMAVLAKPINRAFVIAESKSNDFKRKKRSNKLDEILSKAKLLNTEK